jgi:plasmid replication initiation protein
MFSGMVSPYFPLFSRCRYLLGMGVVQICIHADLKPHFLQLKEKFVQYNLIEYLLLPSIYSQRLYEILMTWRNCPECEIPVADLHDMIGTPKEYQKDFCEFRRRVLEKAHRDINEKTTLRYEWEPIKLGRKVQSIHFIFDQKKQKQCKQEGAQKTKNDNNKNGLEAVACAGAKGVCDKPTNKKPICDACKKMGLLE